MRRLLMRIRILRFRIISLDPDPTKAFKNGKYYESKSDGLSNKGKHRTW